MPRRASAETTSKILSLRYSIGQQMGFVFGDEREKGFVDEMNDVYGAWSISGRSVDISI